MRRVRVVVEGQTEETFVRDVLVDPLAAQGVAVSTTLLTTKRVISGPDHKGGIPRFERVKRQIVAQLRGDSEVLVTTMFDLYGLPSDFPGQASGAHLRGAAKAIHVQTAFDRSIRDHRFRSYIQLHEFEALALANPAGFDLWFDEDAGTRVAAEIHGFATPEDVNERRETAPSKRIQRLFPSYEKVVHGSTIAADAGLERLVLTCPHFGAWYTWLAGLGR